MVTTLGPPERPREPMVHRAFRHPGTGHEVALRVEREAASDDEEPGWWVELEETPGSRAWMVKLRYLAQGTRAQARRDFAKRQRALRAAGYEPVVEWMHTEVRLGPGSAQEARGAPTARDNTSSPPAPRSRALAAPWRLSLIAGR